MAEEVYPSTLFDSSVVGPDHRFVIRRRILKFSGVDHRADTNYAFTIGDVGNLPNIAADSFQGVEPSRPLMSDITTPFGDVASGINKKNVRRLREKAFHQGGILQRVRIHQALIQLAISGNNLLVERGTCLGLQGRHQADIEYKRQCET